MAIRTRKANIVVLTECLLIRLTYKMTINEEEQRHTYITLSSRQWKVKVKLPQGFSPPVDRDVRTSVYNSVTLLGSSGAGYRPCAGSSDVGALLTRAHTYRWGCCLSSTTPVRYCLSPQIAWLEAEFPVCLQMHSGISGCRDKMQQSPLIAQKIQKLHKQAKVEAGFSKRNRKSWLPEIQFSRHMERILAAMRFQIIQKERKDNVS